MTARKKLTVETLQLQTERLVAGMAVPRNVLVSVDDRVGFMRDEVIVRLTRTIATIPGESVLTIPDGWWQAWKAEHLDVLLRWFPVRYRRYIALGFLPEFTLRGAGPVAARWREVEDNGE